jgi:glycosyltransferase involved in cell wall biosynthesis
VVSLARKPYEEALSYWPPWRCVHIANAVTPILISGLARPVWFHAHNLITMGRLVISEKGQDILLRAFSQIAHEFPDWGLTIIGEGPDRKRLEAQVKALGLSAQVYFAGNLRPPFEVIAAADLFVFPSRYEAFGMALAEAMACGLPVISFDCPSGPGDIIRPGVDGLLIPSGDIPALAKAMCQLMSDSKIRMRMALRAPEVCNRFGFDRIINQWLNIIDEVMYESLKVHK